MLNERFLCLDVEFHIETEFKVYYPTRYNVEDCKNENIDVFVDLKKYLTSTYSLFRDK